MTHRPIVTTEHTRWVATNVKVLRPFSDTVTFAWASQNSRIYIVHSNMAPKLYEIAKHTTEDSYC